MARLEEKLALHGYVVDATEALADAERKLVTALGQASTLAGDERGDAAAALLGRQIDALREAARELSEWLDGPQEPA